MTVNYALRDECKTERGQGSLSMWMEMSIGAVMGGLFVMSFALQFGIGVIFAVAVMIAGKGSFLLADLGKPSRALKVLARPGKSWISRGAWGFGVFAIAGIACAALQIATNTGWAFGSGVGLIIGLVACIAAVFMMLYDGFYLASLKGVALWSDGTTPLLFFSSAIVGGLGATSVFAMAGFCPLPGIAQIIALIAYGLCLICFINATSAKTGAAKQGMDVLVNGDLKGSFVGGAIIAGLVIPFICAVLALAIPSAPQALLGIAGACEIIGVICLRRAVLNAGMHDSFL